MKISEILSATALAFLAVAIALTCLSVFSSVDLLRDTPHGIYFKTGKTNIYQIATILLIFTAVILIGISQLLTETEKYEESSWCAGKNCLNDGNNNPIFCTNDDNPESGCCVDKSVWVTGEYEKFRGGPLYIKPIERKDIPRTVLDRDDWPGLQYKKGMCLLWEDQNERAVLVQCNEHGDPYYTKNTLPGEDPDYFNQCIGQSRERATTAPILWSDGKKKYVYSMEGTVGGPAACWPIGPICDPKTKQLNKLNCSEYKKNSYYTGLDGHVNAMDLMGIGDFQSAQRSFPKSQWCS